MTGPVGSGVVARARILARGDGRGGTALPVLEGEGSGEEAPAALVGGGEEPVDGTVGLGGRAVRLPLAGQALAAVWDRPPVRVGHMP